MYINSNGEKIDAKDLETTHLINALAKCSREIFNSKSVEEYNKYMNNIQVLNEELQKRIDAFLSEKIDKEWK